MMQWFENIIAEWSAYQLLGLGLVPSLIIFFIMYFLLLGARSERRLAEWQLAAQQEDTDRREAEIRELELELKQLDDEKDHLDKQLIALSTQLNLQQQHKEQQEQQTEQQLQELSRHFELLSKRFLDEKSQLLLERNQGSLEQVLKPFRERLDYFQQRINELHGQSLQGNSVISEQIKQLLSAGLQIGEEAQALTRALKGDKKALGNWGELQLELALQQAGLEKDRHYKTQVAFRTEDGQRMLPDLLLYLPDDKEIIVDSKVSLVDYQAAISAADDEEQAQRHLSRHVRAVRNHIDDLSAKNYSQLSGLNTPGFVLLFMPIEAAFIAALKADDTLYHYAYNKNVILTSPTTLLPLLKTVSYLWMRSDSHEQALALGDEAMAIYNQAALVAQHMVKLGQTLDTSTRQFNQVVRSFAGQQGVTTKLERFNRLSAKASKEMPELRELELKTELPSSLNQESE
ncbi:DNA recombination protein rmuC [Oligella ureolytica]|uniref:DNA Recombination protein RmuC n=1 Tax=Oligella ureolytica TaxID=90244 RepID=A0A378XG08_9BURK|nr:DNA recombination protein RmuC [Oligella ureolytica]QPT41213.1 DNA recombination protein RmuC [Oligella ureolytica]SUA54114.1 DNA recombination protein rmuC [Oligella ureolytica]SUA55141.1 DNA recombination protein rmuC [Oligella ureolytica]